jgi:hypothetical protein
VVLVHRQGTAFGVCCRANPAARLAVHIRDRYRRSWGCKGLNLCSQHTVLLAAVLNTSGVTCMHSVLLTATHQFGAIYQAMPWHACNCVCLCVQEICVPAGVVPALDSFETQQRGLCVRCFSLAATCMSDCDANPTVLFITCNVGGVDVCVCLRPSPALQCGRQGILCSPS